MRRRTMLSGGAAATAALAGCGAWYAGQRTATSGGTFPVDLSRREWRARLTKAEFAVLREGDTEAPFSSPLDGVWEDGTYQCAGCGNPVYSSETKFDGGTGWPSFWNAISAEAVGTGTDYTLIVPRTEVHCARCGGHLGHVFEDGPDPTGRRHCINGLVLTFRAA